MRKTLGFILLLVLTLMACTGHRYPTKLVVADSLCAANPDSALRLLTQYKDSIKSASKADRMYYELLLADAMNKAYVDMTTDSILKEVTDYYDRHGSANEQMRAHYLLGCAYRDMGEAPMALQCYQDAVDKADTLSGDCNYRLLTSVYGQMAEIYHKQNLPLDEITANKNCQKYSLMVKDTLLYLRNYELMVKPYFLLGDSSAMMKVLGHVYQLYLERGDTLHAIRVYGSSVFIDNLIKQGNLEEARKRINIFVNKSGFFDENGLIYPKSGRVMYYYSIFQYYLANHQIDSAEYYIRELLPYDTHRKDAYRGLLTVYQHRSIADSIAKYAQLYEVALDSANDSRRIETVHQMTSLYNYQRFRDEAESQSRYAERIKWLSLIIVIFLMLLFLYIILHYRRSQREKTTRIHEISKLYNEAKREHNKVRDELSKLKNKDESIISDKEREIAILNKKIYSYRNMLSELNANRQLSKFRESGIIKLLKIRLSRNTPGTVVPEEGVWKKLIVQFAHLAPTAYTTIGREEILSSQELRMCILLLSDFDNNEINLLMNISPQNATNIRAKANKKLFGEDTASSLKTNLTDIYGIV